MFIPEYFTALDGMLRVEKPKDRILAEYYFRLGFMAALQKED